MNVNLEKLSESWFWVWFISLHNRVRLWYVCPSHKSAVWLCRYNPSSYHLSNHFSLKLRGARCSGIFPMWQMFLQLSPSFHLYLDSVNAVAPPGPPSSPSLPSDITVYCRGGVKRLLLIVIQQKIVEDSNNAYGWGKLMSGSYRVDNQCHNEGPKNRSSTLQYRLVVRMSIQ